VLYHHARVIETVYAWERARQLLADPEIVDPKVWMALQARAGIGIGVIEMCAALRPSISRGLTCSRAWL
jgi:NAD-reducing hydrogenase large subunit